MRLIIMQIMSFLLVELLIHQFHSLDQLVRVLKADPFSETSKHKFRPFPGVLQPFKVVSKDLVTVLFFKDTVNQVAAEQF